MVFFGVGGGGEYFLNITKFGYFSRQCSMLAKYFTQSQPWKCAPNAEVHRGISSAPRSRLLLVDIVQFRPRRPLADCPVSSQAFF